MYPVLRPLVCFYMTLISLVDTSLKTIFPNFFSFPKKFVALLFLTFMIAATPYKKLERFFFCESRKKKKKEKKKKKNYIFQTKKKLYFWSFFFCHTKQKDDWGIWIWNCCHHFTYQRISLCRPGFCRTRFFNADFITWTENPYKQNSPFLDPVEKKENVCLLLCALFVCRFVQKIEAIIKMWLTFRFYQVRMKVFFPQNIKKT